MFLNTVQTKTSLQRFLLKTSQYLNIVAAYSLNSHTVFSNDNVILRSSTLTEAVISQNEDVGSGWTVSQTELLRSLRSGFLSAKKSHLLLISLPTGVGQMGIWLHTKARAHLQAALVPTKLYLLCVPKPPH